MSCEGSDGCFAICMYSNTDCGNVFIVGRDTSGYDEGLFPHGKMMLRYSKVLPRRICFLEFRISKFVW